MITKETVIDKIEILETGHLQVRRATYIIEDGKRIAGPMYHRVAYTPGATIDNEDSLVKSCADMVWTPEVIEANRQR